MPLFRVRIKSSVVVRADSLEDAVEEADNVIVRAGSLLSTIVNTEDEESVGARALDILENATATMNVRQLL